MVPSIASLYEPVFPDIGGTTPTDKPTPPPSMWDTLLKQAKEYRSAPMPSPLQNIAPGQAQGNFNSGIPLFSMPQSTQIGGSQGKQQSSVSSIEQYLKIIAGLFGAPVGGAGAVGAGAGTGLETGIGSAIPAYTAAG